VGLIPIWAKDKKIGSGLINARCETVAVKPAFRTAFKKRRCLIPANGFYEWQKAGAVKIPPAPGAKSSVGQFPQVQIFRLKLTPI
jgi:putative SOS response-associated peptidase YedK